MILTQFNQALEALGIHANIFLEYSILHYHHLKLKMTFLRFDGKVAVVTGAGNGLGRAYALLLASRGAKVVVNDLGGSLNGEGSSRKSADIVVQEIRDSGGVAVPNYGSVEFGDKIIQTAIDAWGRVDILINNAGILRDVSFLKMTSKDWDLLYNVHMLGAYRTTKAAWPHMMKNKYGRIVNITSAAGIYGNFGQSNYAAMKLGMVAFTKTLAKEGIRKNIHCNIIAPLAGSRMTKTVMDKGVVSALKPELVAPVVAYLCHEDTKSNGSCYEVGAGWIAKLRWQRSGGGYFSLGDVTPEAVVRCWEDAEDFGNPDYPDSIQERYVFLLS